VAMVKISMKSPKISHLVLAVLLVSGKPLFSADVDGNYAVRGPGAQACSSYLSAVQNDNVEEIANYMAWFEGYLSALNRLSSDTFDHVPLLDRPALARVLVNVCQQLDGQNVEVASAQTINAFDEYRERQQSETRELAFEDQVAILRDATMAVLQTALSELGHYDSVVDGLYGPGTRSALIAFQESVGLPPTGVPDADTVLRLTVGRN